MAVVNVKKKWSSGWAAVERKAGHYLGPLARSSGAEGYTVLFDAADYNEFEACSAQGIPQMDAVHGRWSALTVVRLRASPVGPLLMEVVVEYAGASSPLLDPPRRAWRSKANLEEVNEDADGTLIVNPLGERITGVRIPFYDGLYVFSRNEATDAYCGSDSWRGRVNTDQVTLGSRVCAPGELCIDDIAGEEVPEGPNSWWHVTYTIMRRKLLEDQSSGWLIREPCKGNYYWNGETDGNGNKVLLPCMAGDGVTPITRRLDATGQLLDDEDPDVWLTFKRFKSAAFLPLELS